MPVVLQWLGGAVALVTFLGAAVVYLRGSRDKGTIASLTASNAALTERVRLLDEDLGNCKTRITAVEAERDALKNIVTAAAQIEVLQASLDVHHTEAMGRMDTIHDDLTRLRGGSA